MARKPYSARGRKPAGTKAAQSLGGSPQIDGCPFHFASDQNRRFVRTAPCTGYCSIHKEVNRVGPLNALLDALLRMDAEKLAKLDPAKTAKAYGVKPAHAEGYIRMQRTLIGGQNG